MEKYEALLVSMRQVIRAIDLYSKKLSRETGLTSPQLLILQTIASQDGLMVKEIANAINLSSATVTNILDRLQTRGLVERERSKQDKRKVGLHLTAQGVAIIQNAPKPLQSHFINRFDKLEEWEQTLLLSSMQRIAFMMNADELDAAPVLEVGAIQEPTTE